MQQNKKNLSHLSFVSINLSLDLQMAAIAANILILWAGWFKCLLPQAFDVPGVSEYAETSNMVRYHTFYGEIRSIEKMETLPDYPTQ